MKEDNVKKSEIWWPLTYKLYFEERAKIDFILTLIDLRLNLPLISIAHEL